MKHAEDVRARDRVKTFGWRWISPDPVPESIYKAFTARYRNQGLTRGEVLLGLVRAYVTGKAKAAMQGRKVTHSKPAEWPPTSSGWRWILAEPAPPDLHARFAGVRAQDGRTRGEVLRILIELYAEEKLDPVWR